MTRIRQADSGVQINLTIQDQDGTAVNLTNGTIGLIAVAPDGTSDTKSMTIISAANGTVRYTTDATDFTQVGEYRCQVSVVISGGIDVQTNTLRIYVEEALS